MKCKKSKKFFQEDKGFTLFELLIVIFIIGLISSILIVNVRKGEKQYQVQLAAQEIAQNIRKAQDMALVGFKYDPDSPPPYKYGVFFFKQTPTSYKIFADKNPPDGNDKYDVPDGEVEPISLEKGIEIKSLSSDPKLHITFSLPDGFTTINPSATSATVRIGRTDGNCPQDCKDIIIRNTGQISVE